MLGVEVFRDKQGQGQKQRRQGEEGTEKDAEEAAAAGGEERMDTENGGQNGSEPKVGGSNQETSS